MQNFTEAVLSIFNPQKTLYGLQAPQDMSPEAAMWARA